MADFQFRAEGKKVTSRANTSWKSFSSSSGSSKLSSDSSLLIFTHFYRTVLTHVEKSLYCYLLFHLCMASPLFNIRRYTGPFPEWLCWWMKLLVNFVPNCLFFSFCVNIILRVSIFQIKETNPKIYEVIVSSKIPTKNYWDFCPGSLLEDRTKISVVFGWDFGRNNDLINSF